jgi:transposase
MMSGYSEDLRQRIVSSVKGGMSKAQAALTFSVSLSSLKRYAGKASRGESLAPKKSAGSAPKPDDNLRNAAARTKEALVEAIGVALSAVSAQDAGGFFEHAGYRSSAHLL